MDVFSEEMTFKILKKPYQRSIGLVIYPSTNPRNKNTEHPPLCQVLRGTQRRNILSTHSQTVLSGTQTHTQRSVLTLALEK